MSVFSALGRLAQAPKFRGTIEWQIAGACNYNCSYCIQNAKNRKGSPSREHLGRVLASFAEIAGDFVSENETRPEIKISGGEPFVCADLVDFVAPYIAEKTPYNLSVLTNFSAPIDRLEKFARTLKDRLLVFSTSFHSESVEISAFLEKAKRFRDLREELNPNSSFVVNVVLTPQTLSKQAEWKKLIEDADFRYYPQMMKVGGEPYPYSEREWAQISALNMGDALMAMNRVPCYRGKRCLAGASYFVVDQAGNAFRCRPARRLWNATKDVERSELENQYALGSLVDGSFSLANPWTCPFEHCPCSVPGHRGMVDFQESTTNLSVLEKLRRALGMSKKP